jgi:hypothetical protein
MLPSFEEAIHLVSSSSAAGCLMGAGAKRARIRGTDDRLTSGPCDADPARHLELRRAWDADGWKRPRGLEDLRAAIAGDEPVVLWGTRAFADLVWIWWVIDGLVRIAAERKRLFLARPRPSDPQDTTGGSTPAEARAAFAIASPISDDVLREGADLWRRFASSSPLAFDEARRRGSSAFPELTSSAERHGSWFPRLSGDRLRLSRLDQVLLGSVDDSWRITSAVFEAGGERLVPIVQTFDPVFIVERLRSWAAHGALAREVHADDNPYAQDAFRATKRTRLLLDQGLERVADAPPLYVGGCRVNDPASPWVRIEDDAGWRLALHDRS